MDVNQVISAHADHLRLIVEVADHPTGMLSSLLPQTDAVRQTSTTADLTTTLDRLEAGDRAIVVTDWSTDEGAGVAMSEHLADSGFRVLDAAPLGDSQKPGHDICAIVVKRVAESIGSMTSHDADVRSGRGELSAAVPMSDGDALRVVNDSAVATLTARVLRQRLAAEHDHPRHPANGSDPYNHADGPRRDENGAHAGRAMIATNGAHSGDANRAEAIRLAAKDRVAELERRIIRQRNTIVEQRESLNRIHTSARMRLGTMAVRAARHPLRAIVDVPASLVAIARQRRARNGNESPQKRIVEIMLPAIAVDGAKSSLTLTAPERLHVPRRLDNLGLAGYESQALACYLAAIDVAGPGAVFDIGANIGIYAALASALSGREVRAFEPTPALVAEAENFAVDNGLGYRVEAIALGASNGSATFYLSDKSDSSNSLAKGFRKSSRQIDVPVETLDAYVARTGVKPAVMKVDTETTEPDILAGGAQYITEHRPWILCEVLHRRGEDRLMDVLKPFGYHWYPITDVVPYEETDKIVGDPTYEHLMWLFAPRRPSEEFWTRVREIAKALEECTPAPAGSTWQSAEAAV